MLEGATLVGGKALETDAVQRIVDQQFAFDGRVADLTDAEISVLHAVEGFVDGFEELGKLVRIGPRGSGLEPGPPLDQLAVEA
jgi:hypothetical protein